jgi:hypothetical protein
MQAYRFEARISKDGKIQIPLYKNLIDKDVEVIILSKPTLKSNKITALAFLNKWAGFLNNPNTELDVDSAKYQHLTEKYK